MKKIKTGGRDKGTPNKITKDLRGRINDFLNDNWKTFQDDFDQLAPRDKVYFREKLMQYNAAKQQYTQISTDLNLDKFSDHELDILIERIRNEKYS